MPKEKKLRKKWFRAIVRQRIMICLLLLMQIALVIYLFFDQHKTTDILQGFLTMVSFFVAIHVIAKRDKGSYKMTWVFVILLFPVFGGVLYLFFRYQTRSKKLRKKTEAISQATRKAATPFGDKYEKSICLAPDHRVQIHYLDRFLGFPIYENTSTTYLPLGENYWKSLLSSLETAEHYIFLEFYIIENGVMWSAIHEILKRKASQGVDVRIIYDDIGCFVRLPKDFVKKRREEGIQCIIFNKFRPLLTAVQNSRDHRKIVSIDGKVAFTGGINLADEYINHTHPFGHWKDSGIRLEGEAAWSLTLIFLQMWMLGGNAEPDLLRYYPWRESQCPVQSEGCFVLPYADAPFDGENVSEHVYMQIINNAKKYVYITTPYLIIDDSMISALVLAAKSGVDVRIITPHRWDKRIVHFTTRSYYRELIKAGVKIYEYTSGFIHSKTFVSDDIVANVGTANMDCRSLYLQFECGVWMYQTEAVKAMHEDFLATLNICRQISPEDCHENAFKRFLQDLCRLFAPLM